MKKLSFILAAVLVAATLAGCGGGDVAPTTPMATTGLEAPAVLPFKKLASGGTADLNYANCKSLDVSANDGAVELTFDFARGSEINGSEESDLDGKVPAYTAYMTEAPYRFILEFDYLYYWDYDRALDFSEGDVLISSVFKQFGAADDESFHMVFQLKGDADAKVRQDGSSLTVTLTPKQSEAKSAWYVAADAAMAFTTGEIPLDSGYFPTMDAAAQMTMLISAPFESEDAASAALADFEALYGDMVGNGGVFVVELFDNALPEYNDTTEFKQVYETAVVSIDGEPVALPVVMPDGTYLCSSPNGTASLFSRTITYDDGTTTDELWSMDAAGDFRRVIETDFAAIIQASFSPDGRKAGILEQTSDSSYLYIIDLDTGTLTNLSEEGLGRTTTNFIWDVLGSAIYALSGNDSLQILKYDFTISDDTQRVSAVEEATVEDGGLAFYNGDIYFGSPDKNDVGKVYRIKPEGGIRAEITEGDNFKISPDGVFMALLKSTGQGSEDEETLNNTSIVIRNLNTGGELTVVDRQYVVSFAWAQSGLLYYTVGTDETGEALFGFTLYSFNQITGETVKCADLKNAEFSVTHDPDVLYIPYIQIDENTSIRATYRLELKEQ